MLGGPSVVFGGSLGGWVARVSADDSFRAHVVGRFKSIPSTLPLLVGPYLSAPGGPTDSFIARLAPDGLSLEYCGSLGGSRFEDITEVAVDSAGGAWFAGWTASTDFPLIGTLGTTHSGASDIVVGRVSPTGVSLTYSGLLGGTYGDPMLAGDGTLGALSPFSIKLTNALENTTAWLALGYSTINAPFFGGTLVPDIIPPGLGQLELTGIWPAAVPSGFSFYTQFWINDPGAAFVPVAASNGLQGSTP